MMRTCNKCGWVHFAVTRASAEKSIAEFSAYYATLSKDQQRDHYGGQPSTLANYDRCGLCGGPHTNFREALPDDCPYGCTIGPIIHDEEPQ